MRKKRLSKIISVLLSINIIFTLTSCTDATSSILESIPAETTVVSENTVSAKVSVEGNKFTVDGKELWINGVNTPWQYWNDFSGRMNEQFWDDTFKQLSEDGINCTRIWVNCNGESIVQLKNRGKYTE